MNLTMDSKKNIFELMMRSAENSVSRKVSTILLVSIIAVFTIWGIFSYSTERSRLFQNALSQAEKAGVRLSASLAVPYWNFDFNGIEKIVVSELQDDIIAIVVNETSGRQYIGRVRMKNGDVMPTGDAVKEVISGAFDKKTYSILYTDSKNLTGEPIEIGTVTVFLTDRNIVNALNRSLAQLVIQLVVFIVIILFILIRLVNHFIIKRIIALNGSIIEIENGNYNAPVVQEGNDEISHIAHNIATMSSTILQRELENLKLQNYLASIINSMPSLLVSLDSHGVVKQWNNAAEEFTGVAVRDAIGMVFWDIKPEFERYKMMFHDALATKRSRVMPRESFKNGEQRYFNVSVFPLIEHDEQGVVFRFDDITEIEHKDEQLRQAQKMETVGTLAGGLAHDFNNVLGGIIGTTSLLQYKTAKNVDVSHDELLASINVIDASAKRAADIVQQLLVLSRKHETAFTTVDLSLTIKHVVKICQNTFDKCVEVEVYSDATRAYVSADPVQMEQVLLNLCVNGYHAMTIMRSEEQAQGGALSIGLEQIHADYHFLVSHPEAELNKAYWILSVRDNGVGMSSKTAAKIFDPFFTTKAKEKGTGLGLAMVYNIVQQHGGFIDVYSEEGKGSAFNVFLPVPEEGSQSVVAATKTISVQQGSGSILIVDDELIIRESAKAMLEECGYSVHTEHDGVAGVEWYRQHHGTIDLVLLDMVMPKMSGRDAFLVMKEINPTVKVLLASGFRHDERVDEILKLGVAGFVQKPYTLERISHAVHGIFIS